MEKDRNIGLSYAEMYSQLQLKCKQTNIRQSYDVIVIGVGSMGAATCYHLAKRGFHVLGLEQFDIPHEHGAHSGQSRLIRKAYGEDIAYVPLLERAYENWKTLEAETGSKVYFETGLTYFGNSVNIFLDTVRESATQYQIPLESHVPEQHPLFKLNENQQILFEPEAGFLTPERSIMLLALEALRGGATLRTGEAVLTWEHEPGNVTVTTSKQTYRARKLIFISGAWTGKLLPQLAPKLKVTRQVLGWFQPQHWEPFELGRFPCWFMEAEGRDFYGFPVLPTASFGGPVGLKVALHYPGPEVTDPSEISGPILDSEKQELTEFLEHFLPSGYAKALTYKTCLYTNSPDTHFILDHLDGYHKDVVIGAGFSGHGFKFVSVIGEILADLAVMGRTELPIDFLRLDRFSRQEQANSRT